MYLKGPSAELVLVLVGLSRSLPSFIVFDHLSSEVTSDVSFGVSANSTFSIFCRGSSVISYAYPHYTPWYVSRYSVLPLPDNGNVGLSDLFCPSSVSFLDSTVYPCRVCSPSPLAPGTCGLIPSHSTRLPLPMLFPPFSVGHVISSPMPRMPFRLLFLCRPPRFLKRWSIIFSFTSLVNDLSSLVYRVHWQPTPVPPASDDYSCSSFSCLFPSHSLHPEIPCCLRPMSRAPCHSTLRRVGTCRPI